MKRTLFHILRIVVPIALGVWLVHYSYAQLDDRQREELFEAFRQADLRWLLAVLVLGWLSHVSRAWRWRYLLEPLGHRVGFWNSYHAVMAGYFMNMLLPRAGEASRAVTLYRSEQVPFERGFGSILAERAVDMVMLLGITGITLLLQYDKLDLFQARILAFRQGQEPGGPPSEWIHCGPWIAGAIVLALLAGSYFFWSRPALRARMMDAVRGFLAGVGSVFRIKDKAAFLLHTLLIWGLYVATFILAFNAIPTTNDIPLAGLLAGFIAGSVGIILVQGGIGVYPAFVALIVGMYMAPPEGGGLIRPDALAIGWLLWLVQTAMLIGLGGLSLLLAARDRKKNAP
jgi:hypothetical protein